MTSITRNVLLAALFSFSAASTFAKVPSSAPPLPSDLKSKWTLVSQKDCAPTPERSVRITMRGNPHVGELVMPLITTVLRNGELVSASYGMYVPAVGIVVEKTYVKNQNGKWFLLDMNDDNDKEIRRSEVFASSGITEEEYTNCKQ